MNEFNFVLPITFLKCTYLIFNAFYIRRKQQQQQLTSVIFEKKTEMERLRLQYESLLKAQAEQQEFIDQFQK